MIARRSLDRRRLLAMLAALPAGPAAARLGETAARPGETRDLDVFHDVVQMIGGVATLSPPLLDGCTEEFTRAFGAPAITALAKLARRHRTLDALEANADAQIADQLTWIALFLYSGETAEGSVYYPWCLGWQSLDFATAPGQCGGPFDHWAGPHT
ncbi:sugar dehydrogenase complex small subunit [Sulfitobacter sp. JB4-11]|uniref:sugar dehydrogenase complex small subunit n=1 Tax=Sulfitobacter rhodophyticola TaxID=3238304 RepID=UPI003511C39F